MFKKLFSSRLELWEAQRYSHVVNSNTWSHLHLMDCTEILKLSKRNRQTFFILPIYITFLCYLYFVLYILFMYMLVLKYFNIMEGQNRRSNEQDLSPGSPVGIIGHTMAENCSLVYLFNRLMLSVPSFFSFFAVFLRKGCSQQAAYLVTAEE